MKRKTVSATDFKAHCLGLLDQVSNTGVPVVVTKRGKPVATLQPMANEDWPSPEGAWKGKVLIEGDIVNTDWEWDAARED